MDKDTQIYQKVTILLKLIYKFNAMQLTHQQVWFCGIRQSDAKINMDEEKVKKRTHPAPPTPAENKDGKCALSVINVYDTYQNLNSVHICSYAKLDA